MGLRASDPAPGDAHSPWPKEPVGRFAADEDEINDDE